MPEPLGSGKTALRRLLEVVECQRAFITGICGARKCESGLASCGCGVHALLGIPKEPTYGTTLQDCGGFEVKSAVGSPYQILHGFSSRSHGSDGNALGTPSSPSRYLLNSPSLASPGMQNLQNLQHQTVKIFFNTSSWPVLVKVSILSIL